MEAQYVRKARKEYQDKLKLKTEITNYYQNRVKELNLKSFSRIKAYLPDQVSHITRDIIFAHLEFEPFTTNIAKGEEFTVVSGLNPSSPLHLGHKALFDILLFLQKLGANIFIPVTNDESYVDSKVKSLSESRRIAYEEVIPSIITFGFDPKKTKIFVDSDYPDIYNFAMYISKNITHDYVKKAFGIMALDNSGKAFYRSAVQLAHILLPQLNEFGGVKHTLIPVGIDQHPYILLARDIAKKMKFIPPSELVFKFQTSLRNPSEKMSGSKSKTAIYLSDSPNVIKEKIQRAFTGSVSVLKVHRELGGIPEICSVFSLLYYHHPDEKFVSKIYRQYKKGQITMDELKEITTDFITKIVLEHQKRKKAITDIDKFILKTPLKSFLEYGNNSCYL